MTQQDPAASGVIEPSAFQPLGSADAKPPRRRHTGRWLLLACAALFALLMGFLLSARSLQVLVNAETPADVAISGLALPFGERYLLRPGDYSLRVTAAGYHPLETGITVTAEDSQTLQLELAPLPGRVSFASTPAGATVLLDGEVLGRTPLADQPVEAGEHLVRIEAERYLPLEQSLQVTGREVAQQLAVELAPGWAEVSLDSQPPGAAILVDGEQRGTTPALLEIDGGEHQLILQRPGYADWQQSVDIVPGQPLQLDTAVLQPAAGVLELASVPAGANVTLDGEFLGQTPLQLELVPDRAHQLAVFKPGYRRHSSTVQLAAAARDSQTITLKAQLGEVRFEISPANATLKIDGQVRGQGSQTLSLPAFEHSVEISLPGYATVRRKVTPRPGLQQRVAATLLTEQQARKARIKPEITTSLGQTLLLFTPAQSPLSTFTMGASRREPGRRANEVLHPVSLTPRLLPADHRGEQRPVPPVQGRPQLRPDRGQQSQPRPPARRPGELAAGGRLLQLAERARGPAALLPRDQRHRHRLQPLGHRLPPAQRGGVGLGGARQRRRVAEVPLGRDLPAHRAGGKLCRQQFRLCHRPGTGGLQGRLRGQRPGGLPEAQPAPACTTWAATSRSGCTTCTAFPRPTAPPKWTPWAPRTATTTSSAAPAGPTARSRNCAFPTGIMGRQAAMT